MNARIVDGTVSNLRILELKLDNGTTITISQVENAFLIRGKDITLAPLATNALLVKTTEEKNGHK